MVVEENGEFLPNSLCKASRSQPLRAPRSRVRIWSSHQDAPQFEGAVCRRSGG